jgi:hypothetical protein
MKLAHDPADHFPDGALNISSLLPHVIHFFSSA